MARYVLRRILISVPLLIGISVITFVVINMAPGGPIGVASDLNPKATAEYRERLKACSWLPFPIPAAGVQ